MHLISFQSSTTIDRELDLRARRIGPLGVTMALPGIKCGCATCVPPRTRVSERTRLFENNLIK